MVIEIEGKEKEINEIIAFAKKKKVKIKKKDLLSFLRNPFLRDLELKREKEEYKNYVFN